MASCATWARHTGSSLFWWLPEWAKLISDWTMRDTRLVCSMICSLISVSSLSPSRSSRRFCARQAMPVIGLPISWATPAGQAADTGQAFGMHQLVFEHLGFGEVFDQQAPGRCCRAPAVRRWRPCAG